MAVRWKTVRSPALLASSGMSCTAVAPVPINPIRLPAGLKSSSQAVVWMILPSKPWMPGMSGVCGWDRNPVAVIRYRALSVPPSPRATRHNPASSSQRAPSTVVWNRMWRRTSYLSATSSAYCLISAPVENSRDQFGLGSKK